MSFLVGVFARSGIWLIVSGFHLMLPHVELKRLRNCGLRFCEAHIFQRGTRIGYFFLSFLVCWLAFCFCALSLSFFPPLSPMVSLLSS